MAGFAFSLKILHFFQQSSDVSFGGGAKIILAAEASFFYDYCNGSGAKRFFWSSYEGSALPKRRQLGENFGISIKG